MTVLPLLLGSLGSDQDLECRSLLAETPEKSEVQIWEELCQLSVSVKVMIHMSDKLITYVIWFCWRSQIDTYLYVISCIYIGLPNFRVLVWFVYDDLCSNCSQGNCVPKRLINNFQDNYVFFRRSGIEQIWIIASLERLWKLLRCLVTSIKILYVRYTKHMKMSL